MTAVAVEQIAADLLSAANHIETFGLRKYFMGSQGKPCCAGGAIQVAVYGDTVGDLDEVRRNRELGRERAARDALMWHLTLRRIAPWNDDALRTTAEVVAALRGAAAQVAGLS